MKKLLFVLLLSLMVAACGSPSVTEPEATENEVPAVAAVPEPEESEPEASEPTTAVEDTTGTQDTAAAEHPIAATVAEAAEIRETDWVKGAEDPLVTIIEYGDFQ